MVPPESGFTPWREFQNVKIGVQCVPQPDSSANNNIVIKAAGTAGATGAIAPFAFLNTGARGQAGAKVPFL